MGWRERLQPASLGGISFFVLASDRSGGRRSVLHEFPFKDDPSVDDLGRRARVFEFEAIILGDDYFDTRDQLLGVLETEGSHELIHPFYGRRQVSVGEFRVRETAQEGGSASFQISVVETPINLQPSATPDPGSVLQSAIAAGHAASLASFVSSLRTDIVLDSAVGVLSQAVGAMRATLATVTNLETQAFAAAEFELDRIVGTALRTPADLYTSMQSAFAGLQTTGVTLVYDFDPGVRPVGTSLLVGAEQANFDSVHRMVQQQALLASGQVLLGTTFVSFDDAIAQRELNTARIDDQELNLTDDSLYLPLQNLRAALVAAVPGRLSDLPRLVSVPLPSTTPSLVLAWKLYGSLDREQDVIDRNDVQNPLFVPAGPLAVLSDE